MAARKKIIKRVYEKGREMVVLPARRASSSKKAAKTPPRKYPVNRIPDAEQEKRPVRTPVSRRVISEDAYDLPGSYGVTRVALLAKDPLWMYAYWEAAPEHIEIIKRQLTPETARSAKMVLRVYDVTLVNFNGNNANFYFDIEVGFHSNNWYINLYHDCASFVADIGLKASDGRFFAMARSNYVRTSRMMYAARSEQIWMKVTDEKAGRPFITPGIKPSANRARRAETADTRSPASKSMRGKRFYITDDEIRRYYSRLSPLLRDIIAKRLGSYYGRKARKLSFIVEGDSDIERRQLLSRLPKGYFLKRIVTGSSHDLVVLGESQEGLPGSSEQHLQKSSDFVTEKAGPRKFFFELNTELIVYGRTEPDAEVWLGDKKIDLRPDGTFSMRFALPDGEIPLEFKAVSKDKIQKRRIST
ncbi:MAG: DUF4912 domain-containing protein, partial [Candidatus Omnitrophota bacterium]